MGHGIFTFFYFLSAIRPPKEAWLRTCVNVLFIMALFYGNAKLVVNHYMETSRLRELLVVLLFSTLYQLVENRRKLELQHLELESKHTEAQLNYLKAQINPHFFNTLNNIYAAATLQYPRTADVVLRLSELLRYVTYDAQAKQVPLEKEIAQIRAYIDLFQLKSETPLRVLVDIVGDPKPYLIEPMLLLPMVENALKHGDLELNPVGFLNVKVEIRPSTLHFVVTNSFDPQNRQKDDVGGVGLENVRQRLALNYPGKYRFELRADDHVFTADLECSLITA